MIGANTFFGSGARDWREKTPECAPGPQCIVRALSGSCGRSAARAVVDIAATVTVTIVALAGLFGDGADQCARDATDGSADGGATNIAGCQSADNGAGAGADCGALFGLGAACHRQADRKDYQDFLHGVLQ